MSCLESTARRCEGVSRIFRHSVDAILQKQKIDETHGGKAIGSSENVNQTRTTDLKTGATDRKIKVHQRSNTAVEHAAQNRPGLKHSSCDNSTEAARKTTPKKKIRSPRKKRSAPVKTQVVRSLPSTDSLKETAGKEESKLRHNRKVNKRIENRAAATERDTTNQLILENDKNNNNLGFRHINTMEIPQPESVNQNTIGAISLAEEIKNSNDNDSALSRIDGSITLNSIGRQSNTEFTTKCDKDDIVKATNIEINGNMPGPDISIDECILKKNDVENLNIKSVDNERTLKVPAKVTRVTDTDLYCNTQGHPVVLNENTSATASGGTCVDTLPTDCSATDTTPVHAARYYKDKSFNQEKLINTSRHAPRWKVDNTASAPWNRRSYASRSWQRPEHRPRRFGDRRFESRRSASQIEHESSNPNISLPETDSLKHCELPVLEDWSNEANACYEKSQSSIKPLKSEYGSVQTDASGTSIAPVNTDSSKDTNRSCSKAPYLPPPPPPEEEVLVHNFQGKTVNADICKIEETLADISKKKDVTLTETIISDAQEQLSAIKEFQDGHDNGKTAELHDSEREILSFSDTEIRLVSKLGHDKNETQNSIVLDEPVKEIPDNLEPSSNSIVFSSKSLEENTSNVRSCFSTVSSKSGRSNTTVWTDKSGNEAIVSESNQADISDNACSDSSCQGYEYISCRSKADSDKQSDIEYSRQEKMYSDTQLLEQGEEKNTSSECKPGWNVSHQQDYEGYLNWYHRQMNAQWMRYLDWCRYCQNRQGNKNTTERIPERESVCTSNVSEDKGQNIQDTGTPRHCTEVKESLHNKPSSASWNKPTGHTDSRLSDYWTEKLPDWVDNQSAGSVNVKFLNVCGNQETGQAPRGKEKLVHNLGIEETVGKKFCVNREQFINADQRNNGMGTFREQTGKDSATADDVKKESVPSSPALHDCDCKPGQVKYLVWRMCQCDAGNPPILQQVLPGHRDENIVQLACGLHEPPEKGPVPTQQSVRKQQSTSQCLTDRSTAPRQTRAQNTQEPSTAQLVAGSRSTHPPGYIPLPTEKGRVPTQQSVRKQQSTSQCRTDRSTAPRQTRAQNTQEPSTVQLVAGSRSTPPPGYFPLPTDRNKSEKSLLHTEESKTRKSSLGTSSNKSTCSKSSRDLSSQEMEPARRCTDSSSNKTDMFGQFDPSTSAGHAQSTGLEEQVVLSVDNINKDCTYPRMPECLHKSVGHLAKAETELKKAGRVQVSLGSAMETISKAINVIQHTLQLNQDTLTADLGPAQVTVNAPSETSKEYTGHNKENISRRTTILEDTSSKAANIMETKDQKIASVKNKPSKCDEPKFRENTSEESSMNFYEPEVVGEKYSHDGHSEIKSISSKDMKEKCVGVTSDRNCVCVEDEYCAVSVDGCSDATGVPIASQSPAEDDDDGEIKENEFLIPDSYLKKCVSEPKETGMLEEGEIEPNEFQSEMYFQGPSQAGFGHHPGHQQEWLHLGNEYPPFGRIPPPRYRMPPWHNSYRPMAFPPQGSPHPNEKWMSPYCPPPYSLPSPSPWNRYPMNWESSPPRNFSSQEGNVGQYCEYPPQTRNMRDVNSLSSNQRKKWMKKDDTKCTRDVTSDRSKVKLVDYETSDDNGASDNNELDMQNGDNDFDGKNSKCSNLEASRKPTPKKLRTDNGVGRDAPEENVEGNDSTRCLTRKVSGKLKQKTLKMFYSPDSPGPKLVEKRMSPKHTLKEVSTKSAKVVSESPIAMNSCKESGDIEFSQEFPELSKDFSPDCLPGRVGSLTALPPLPPFPASPFWGMYLPSNTSALSGNSPQHKIYPQQGREHRPMSAKRDQPRTKIYSRRSWPLTFQGNAALSSSDSESLPRSDWKTSFRQFHSFGVKYIDTHCHLDFLFNREGFHGNLRKYMDEHKETFPDMFAGCVAVFCNPATFLPKSGLWLEVAKEDNVWIAMGCHPKMALDFTPEAEQGLRKCLSHHKCIALGEIGLDYSKTFQQHEAVQKEVFRKQLKLALKMEKPLVIHCRDAEQDCLDILKEVVPRNYKIHCHCFTGYYSNARLWLDAFPNLYIGVTPLVTYRSAHPSHDLARKIPLGRLLLETDAPYFIPRCIPKEDLSYSTPGLAVTVAKEIAKYQELPVAAVLRQCRLNTKFMYGI